MQWFGYRTDLNSADRDVAMKLFAAYALFSCLWIAVSDTMLHRLIPDPALLNRINFLKDFLFILLTAVFLYKLIKRNTQLAHNEKAALSQIKSHAAVLHHYRSSRQDALEKLAIIAGGVPTLIAHLDTNQRYLYVNANYAAWAGRPEHEIIGATVREIIGDEIYQTTVDCIRLALDGRFAFMERTAGVAGEERIQHMSFVPRFDEQGKVTSYFALIDDITGIKQTERALQASVAEQRKIEEQLRQAQKMEAIGTMAGGVAHDFNNILTVILGCADMLQSKPDIAYKSAPYLDQIIDAANRAAGFTRSLLAFSRQQGVEMSAIDLNSRIRQLNELLQRIIGEDISISLSLSRQQLNVMADGGQLDQVVMNMISNARDAMPDGGSIAITSYQAEHKLPQSGSDSEPPAITCAVLEICDTGTGMNSTTLGRIFDPFYTTKEVGKGTGLGLSMAYGIIKGHNGLIEVTSEPGAGTTFRIILPCISEAPEKIQITSPLQPRKGNETILLVEDDPVVRHMVTKLLVKHGYHVLAAEDGEAGLELFRSAYTPIDLILSDVIMPRKNGIEMAREIRASQPGMPMVFMSGYAADYMEQFKNSGEVVSYVAKPLNVPTLLNRLREALESPYLLSTPIDNPVLHFSEKAAT
jgi:PAS domain S-box-containing protein